jgi:prepilin signal peptidase PulO-like enzyme (type II secretory pathway)
MVTLLLILLGLVLGSFVNALVWRLHEKRNWIHERSECTHCHHQLGVLDLIPVFSWLWLRGKCRYCSKPIEDTPLTELAVPALFVLSYYYWPLPLQGEGLFTFIVWLIFIVGFVALAVYDIRWFLLPNKIVFPLMGLAVFQLLVEFIFFSGSWRDLLGAALGVIVISGLFYALFVFSRGTWIGFGDVKLGVVLGLLAGGPLPALLLLFIASVLGMIFSLPLLFAGKASRKSYVPFGPFLLAAMVVVELFGSSLIDWYRHLFLA